MKAKYIGDPTQPKGAETVPDEFTAYGVTFERGKFTDVPDALADKFAGNNHFETQHKEPAAASPPETVAALTERISTATDVEALEKELASETRTSGKTALQARIDALKAA